MTNGVRFPGTDMDLQYNDDPMRFWRNDGPNGPWPEVSQQIGITDTGSGKGLAVFDYEDDGDEDLFVVNSGSTPRLYRNDGGNADGFLRVRVRGTRSNRDGFGAKVSLRAVADGPVQVREIGSTSAFLGQSERVAHFGLGPGAGNVAELRVFWPKSGAEQVFTGVPPNQSLTIVEPVS